jgi:hypothetical protein
MREGEDRSMQNKWGRWFQRAGILILGIFMVAGTLLSNAQSQQEVNVTIEGYKFQTSQMPLQLHTDTIIRVKNLDNVGSFFPIDSQSNGSLQISMFDSSGHERRNFIADC